MDDDSIDMAKVSDDMHCELLLHIIIHSINIFDEHAKTRKKMRKISAFDRQPSFSNNNKKKLVLFDDDDNDEKKNEAKLCSAHVKILNEIRVTALDKMMKFCG